MTWFTALLRRPPIGWWDLADILVVSFLIYEVLKLIRGTRAVQMALGGCVLVALFYGSRWGHLDTVNWLVRNMIGYMVFAAIVLFQSDIRRALAHFGRAPFFRYLNKRESAEESVEELVVAASLLSSQRIGAIIAIERQIGLRNYIEGGIRLDAVLTYDLLQSIFLPASPLHDGAVIVQEDRVASAACFLPLTVNPKLSKELGSRHRAAIGLTEENDSVAIVVSEETGLVSIVVDGQIERGLDSDQLRARLRAFVLQRSDKAVKREVQYHMTAMQRVRHWIFGNAWLKLLSVGLALMLWMVVSGEETVERGLRVPLELTQVPANLELLGDVPATVDVRVRGASGTLSRVGTGDVVAVLDLRTAQSGHRLFPLTPDQVRVPFGVEIVQVQPSAVTMSFETSASREVPIAPAVDGRPAPGYVVGPLSAEPRTVAVIGPESAVKRATEVVTEPVSVQGAIAQVKQTVILGLVDPSLRLKTARSATVTVQILPAPLEKALRNQPVHLRNLGPNLQAEAIPAAVELTLRGNREALARVAADDYTAFIDLAGLGPGQYSLTVHADFSRDAGVTRVTPESVQVRITSGK